MSNDKPTGDNQTAGCQGAGLMIIIAIILSMIGLFLGSSAGLFLIDLFGG